MYKAGYILILSLLSASLDICGQIAYHEAVMQGLRFQIQADSMQRLADAKTIALAAAPESEKSRIRFEILDFDIKAATFQKIADERFAQAAAFENITATNAALEVKTDNFENTTNETEAIKVWAPEFSILFNSPYSASNPIPIDEPLPDGVVYKIQLGAFSRPAPANTFRGLAPVSGERLENGVIRYYAGLFRLFSDADDALRKVRTYGFNDAFIVAFFNRITINIDRARQLE